MTKIAVSTVFAALVAKPGLVSADPESPAVHRESVSAERQKAELLLRYGQYDKATEQYEWLWDNMVVYEPSMWAVRLSFLTSEIQRLAERHDPAREIFLKKRDRLDQDVQQGVFSFDSLQDWIALNTIVGEDRRTTDWVLSFADRENGQELFDRAGFIAEDILIELGEYDLYAELKPDLLSDTLAEILRHKRVTEIMAQSDNTSIASREPRRIYFIKEIAKPYLVCLKTGRAEDAESIANVLNAAVDDERARTSLIRTALDHGAAQPTHLEWLDELDQQSPTVIQLRNEIIEALDLRSDE